MKKLAQEMLEDRGVLLKDIAEIVLVLQQSYLPDLTLKECVKHIDKVLEKREVQNAILTGLVLDMYAEKKYVATTSSIYLRRG